MKLFIGLTEVSGYYYNLKKGFDELGIHCAYVPLQAHAFRYQDNEKLSFLPWLVRVCVTRRVAVTGKNILAKVLWLGAVSTSRVVLFLWAIAKYDVFILGGGSSFFRFFEFPLLRLLGKKIVYTFHGTDSRPGYIDGFCEGVADIPKVTVLNSQHRGDGGLKVIVDARDVMAYAKIARKRRRDVAIVERYANVVVNAPPQGQFHARPFVIGLAVGIPVTLQRENDIETRKSKRDGVCILHSPSRIEGKGTLEIRGAIDRLLEKGHRIRYIEISGRPNDEVVATIEECDFVVDQVYADNPMAGFAAEAALRGKPAVVGGYYSMFIREDIPTEFIPPSLYCHPAGIESAIEKLIVDVEFRLRLGRQAQAFVKERWSPRCVSGRYLQLVRDEIPSKWIYDPSKNRYVHGMGLNEAKARTNVQEVIKRFGKAGLQLSENPELEERFVQFAYAEAPHATAAV